MLDFLLCFFYNLLGVSHHFERAIFRSSQLSFLQSNGNSFNPKKSCVAILYHHLSWSFLVMIAFGNLVLCLLAHMHIDVLLGSE